MTRDEKSTILAALEVAINNCMVLAEDAEDYEDKQYQWGKADGLERASVLIAQRPEAGA